MTSAAKPSVSDLRKGNFHEDTPTPLPLPMATIQDDDVRLLARIGYKQVRAPDLAMVPTGTAANLISPVSDRSCDENLKNGPQYPMQLVYWEYLGAFPLL